MKNIIIVFVLAISVSACENKLENAVDDNIKLCSCLNIEDINKTIPIVNEFLEGLPDDRNKEETFESLVAWFNSFPCNIDAKIIYGTDLIWGEEMMTGVSISVTDNKIVREMELDFDNPLTCSQIKGYVYYKQDAIHVKTKYTNINNVFDFINILDLDVNKIYNGAYLSSMAANADTLQHIIDNLKAKPYTTDAHVTGHLHWYNANIVIFLSLYDMKNTSYQADWEETMNKYKLENYIDGPEYTIVFYIPEGTGKQWEKNFTEYDFVRFAELSYTRYTIQ